MSEGARTTIDCTVLLEAICFGRIEVARLLLERGADPNVTDPGDASPLMEAAWRGQVHLMRELVQREANFDTVDADGCTAFHILRCSSSLFCFGSWFI